MSDLLETVRYGTDAPDAPDNFDEYVTFTKAYTFTRLSERRFNAQARFWRLNGLVVSEQKLGGSRATRMAAEQAAAPLEHLTFIVLFSGQIKYYSSTHQAVCQAGDILLLDYRQRFELISPDQHSAAISIARELIEKLTGSLDGHGLLPHRAETVLLHNFVRALVSQLPMTHLHAVKPIAESLRHLMVAAINGLSGNGAPGVHSTSRQRAVEYMRVRQPGPLDIAEMVRSLGITRATLYRLFKADGGLRSFDREMRLRALHQAICRSGIKVQLGRLASEYGFDNMSSLANQFRQRYGISMSELRSYNAAIQASVKRLDSISEYRQSVKSMSFKCKLQN